MTEGTLKRTQYWVVYLPSQAQKITNRGWSLNQLQGKGIYPSSYFLYEKGGKAKVTISTVVH